MPLEIILWKCSGPVYLTRDGRRAAVVESNVIMAGPRKGLHIWQGRVEGEWVEWDKEGRHLEGQSGLDLVSVAEIIKG